MMHNPWSVTLESNSGLADRKMIDTRAAHISFSLSCGKQKRQNLAREGLGDYDRNLAASISDIRACRGLQNCKREDIQRRDGEPRRSGWD